MTIFIPMELCLMPSSLVSILLAAGPSSLEDFCLPHLISRRRANRSRSPSRAHLKLRVPTQCCIKRDPFNPDDQVNMQVIYISLINYITIIILHQVLANLCL
jgi:hypothetical protein